MIDSAGEPMRAAFAPWLDIDLTGLRRLEALLLPALDQVLEGGHGEQLLRSKVALALGLPAERPGLPPNLASMLAASVQAHIGSFAAVGPISKGHAAGILCLDAALRRLRDGAFDVCVVAGVDSYLEPDTLEWLETNDQLHGAGALNNAWGFIPGEAGGALLVMTETAVDRFRCEPLAELVAVGTAIEPNRIKTDSVCVGVGLTQAFRNALKDIPPDTKVTDIYCDMNGEPYRADEFGFATVRTAASFVDSGDFQAPADCWGDVGAASGPLFAILAIIARQKAYSNGGLALAWASSEGGERAATLLQSLD
jgi:3-oxoacyl-[acyl-carrier-protein] synthase-1